MHQELAEQVIASWDMHDGSRCLASVPEFELLHPPVDLSLLRGSLEGSPLQHASAGRGPKKMHSDIKLGVVLVLDRESGNSEARDAHYREEDVVYCEWDYGVDAAEADKEAVLYAVTSKYQDFLLPNVEDVDVAQCCKAK